MLGLAFITLVSIFINLKTCPKSIAIYLINAFLIFIGGELNSFFFSCVCHKVQFSVKFKGSCGAASLIIFGVRVYEPSKHNLQWCFWASVAAVGIQLIGLVFILFIYSLRMMYVFKQFQIFYFDTKYSLSLKILVARLPSKITNEAYDHTRKMPVVGLRSEKLKHRFQLMKLMIGHGV